MPNPDSIIAKFAATTPHQEYADNRGHVVFWMTAEEREEYTRQLQELDDRIAGRFYA